MDKLPVKIESLLFYTQDSLTVKELAEKCDVKKNEVRSALSELDKQLKGRGISLVLVDDTAQLTTSPEFSNFLDNIREEEINTDLTEAQSEALAIIAYLAPVQKVKIDFIRGVNSRAVLRNLSIRGLIDKKTKNGKTTYNLTPETLAHLGIKIRDELPDYEETKENLENFSENQRLPH